MKILVLTFYYPPDLCACSFRSVAFVNALKRTLGSNDEIEILTTMPNRYHSFRNDAVSVESYENLTIKRINLPNHKSGMVDQSKAFAKYATAALHYVNGKKYDRIFATSSRLFTAFLGAILSRKTKASLYLDIRDIFTDTLKDVLNNSALKIVLPALRMVEKFTIKSAFKVNLVSQGFAEYFRKVAPEPKYSFFPNGIDDEFLDYSFEKTNPSDKKIILYAGNIGEGQGLEKIIPGCAKALEDSCEFWVIGDGGKKDRLEASLQQQSVQNVRLMKPVARTELLNLYGQSDYLFMHLNNYEAFKKVLPSKVFEYASTGKPILAGVGGFSKYFIETDVQAATVFEPCDVDDFLNKFKNLKSTNVQRTAFINKYKRENIMREMVEEFLST